MGYTDEGVSSERLVLFQSGAPLFSRPLEVDHWCQTIPFGQALPLTPPETASDCAMLDSPDMTSLPWIRASLPDETWYPEPTRDNSTCALSSGDGWTHSFMVSFVPESQAQDTRAWSNPVHGSVDWGVSPALSYESRSTHTLNTFSDAESSLHSQSLDQSIVPHPSWNVTGTLMDPAYEDLQQPLSGSESLYSSVQCPRTSIPQASYTSIGFHGLDAPLTHPSVGQSGQMFHYPNVTPRRPLLPRIERNLEPSSLGHFPPRHVTGLMRRGPSVHPRMSVSSSADHRTTAQVPTSGLASAGIAPAPAEYPSRAHPPRSISPLEMGTAVMDPTADDFSAFIDLPMDEQALANGLASPALPDPLEPWREFHPPIYRSDDPSESGVQSPGVQAKSPTDSKTIATPIVSASASSDVDEGRYRTHALYSVGPGVDGLYHCPFRPKENCPHEPNKLKCNYEYAIFLNSLFREGRDPSSTPLTTPPSSQQVH